MTRLARILSLFALAWMLASPGVAAAHTSTWGFVATGGQVRNAPTANGRSDSPGRAFGSISWEPHGGVLSFDITWQDLAGDLTAIHVHGPATVDESSMQHLIDILLDVDAVLAAGLDRRNDSYQGSRQYEGDGGHGHGSFVMPLHAGGHDADIETILDALEDGLAYVNVHTTLWPHGELRGNVGVPIPEPGTAALLCAGLVLMAIRSRRIG